MISERITCFADHIRPGDVIDGARVAEVIPDSRDGQTEVHFQSGRVVFYPNWMTRVVMRETRIITR